jgi:MYXO-CTERM domain-containing protein
VSCAGDQSCVDGVCVEDPCALLDCPDGQTCTDGACHADPCAGIVCDSGRVCLDGLCGADPCAGVACPPGEVCSVDAEGRAQCAAAWAPDAGPGGDGGPGAADAGGRDAAPDPGGERDTASGFEPSADGALVDRSADGGAGEPDPAADAISSGCACESAGRTSHPVVPALLAVGLMFARRRRRR